MTASIKDVILARAGEMAAHDGTAIGIVHLIGAVNQIHLDLTRARDELIAGGQAALAPAKAEELPEQADARQPDAAAEPDAAADSENPGSGEAASAPPAAEATKPPVVAAPAKQAPSRSARRRS